MHACMHKYRVASSICLNAFQYPRSSPGRLELRLTDLTQRPRLTGMAGISSAASVSHCHFKSGAVATSLREAALQLKTRMPYTDGKMDPKP